MMNIIDELAALKSGMDALKAAILASLAATRVEVVQHNDEVTALKARIAELETLPTITPEQQAELDALRASQDELLTLIAAKDPTDPTVIPDPAPAIVPVDPPANG